jgi:uncharacterized protein (TIGR00645 family)
MTAPDPTSTTARGGRNPHGPSPLEAVIERVLFASRWLLAPLYLGMVAALVVIVIKFFEKLWQVATTTLEYGYEDVMLGILALLDLALLANLVLIVIFAGYENFVSKINAARNAEDRPRWMGHVDFSGLKMKLIGSIVAISAIGLLQDFTNISTLDPAILFWRVVLHLTFVLSGLLFAIMDWLGEKRLVLTRQTHGHADESDD